MDEINYQYVCRIHDTYLYLYDSLLAFMEWRLVERMISNFIVVVMYLCVVQDLEMFSFSEAQVLVRSCIVVVKGYEDFRIAYGRICGVWLR